MYYYNIFIAACQGSKFYIYRCAVSRGSSRNHRTDFQTILNIIMDITHGAIFVAVWFVVGLVAIYLMAVYSENKRRREEDKEKYKNNPIDVFWRNLK